MEDAKPWEWDWTALMALLAACVALYGTWRANKIATKSLSASVDLELARYEEKWFCELREAMTVMLTGIDNVNRDSPIDEQIKELSQVKNRVLLYLNPNDEKYNEFRQTCSAYLAIKLGAAAVDENGNKYPVVKEMDAIKICQEVLELEKKQFEEKLKKYNAKNK